MVFLCHSLLTTLVLTMVGTTPTAGMTVMVTGANGFIASYVVKNLLEKGHKVHACVRNATNAESVHHLLTLPAANEQTLSLFSTGDLGSLSKKGDTFDASMVGVDAVFHAATPLSAKFGSSSGEDFIYKPTMASTQELLDCIGRNKDTVKCIILTSSMSSLAPQPEPALKDESHWSDPEAQKKCGSWYGAAKTEQECLVQKWVEDQKSSATIPANFKYVAICPTMVLGPNLNPAKDASSGTMGRLLNWFQGGRSQAPNDSMSFVHVEDCARMHTNALELPDAYGRYMCLVESLHWNVILLRMKELYPAMPDVTLYEGSDKIVPTQFNMNKMHTLGVPVRSIEDILKDSLSYFRTVGALE